MASTLQENRFLDPFYRKRLKALLKQTRARLGVGNLKLAKRIPYSDPFKLKSKLDYWLDRNGDITNVEILEQVEQFIAKNDPELYMQLSKQGKAVANGRALARYFYGEENSEKYKIGIKTAKHKIFGLYFIKTGWHSQGINGNALSMECLCILEVPEEDFLIIHRICLAESEVTDTKNGRVRGNRHSLIYVAQRESGYGFVNGGEILVFARKADDRDQIFINNLIFHSPTELFFRPISIMGNSPRRHYYAPEDQSRALEYRVVSHEKFDLDIGSMLYNVINSIYWDV